jgi:hypothetical protein
VNHTILDDPFRARLVEAIAVVDIEFTDLWLRYLAHDGSCDAMDVEAYLAGLATISDLEHDILTETVNERLEELGCRPAALLRGGACVATAAGPTSGAPARSATLDLARSASAFTP